MLSFKTEISGEESLDEDIDKEVVLIKHAAAISLDSVGVEMVHNLQQHIKDDWYLPWGKPKEYIRRTDTGQQGAMDDPTNMSVQRHGLTLNFVYSPLGNRYWPGHNADGDRLIEIIQTNEGWYFAPSKDQSGRKIMPRPFWNRFVEEQYNGGIMDVFIAAMKDMKYEVVKEGGDKDLDISSGESKLAAKKK